MAKTSIVLAGSLALAMASAHAAQATPYAYAEVNFSNLSLTGLATGTINGATVTTSSSASYNDLGDAATGGPTVSGTGPKPLTGGSDTRASAAGMGQFPGPNVFGEILTADTGTRADALLSGNLLTGSPKGSGNAVVEGRLIDFGEASSTGGTTTGFNFSFKTGTHTLVLTFTASETLVATSDGDGDGASAGASASFSIVGPGMTDLFALPDFNASVSSSAGAGDGLYTLPSTVFTHTVRLTTPGAYQITLSSGVQERLSSAPVDVGGPPSVPEPASVALLLGALALLPAVGWRVRR